MKYLILPLLVTTTTAQNLPGCYPTWQPNSKYPESALVSLSTLINSTLGTYKDHNYQCKDSPLDQYCGQIGYQPGLNGGTGAWNLVWVDLGECSGNAVLDPPTSSPTLSSWSGIGCPQDFEMGSTYAEGDRVVGLDGYVYECKPYPYNGYCGQQGFAPGKIYSRWEEAWVQLGSCSGTLSPTSSPNYNLPIFGGCPEEFDSSAVYEGGDKVSYNGLAFQCKPFPYSAWCGQEGYAPITSDKFRDAWEILGKCDGTISPTSSPAFYTIGDVGGCPGVYVEGIAYEASDRVTLLIEVGRGVVYKCADQWPESGYCSLIPPGHASNLGWTIQGSCSGTIAPSTSPVFVSLPDTSGCPIEYSSSTTYETGDRVAVYLDSERAVVWECDKYPDGAYCNQYPPSDDPPSGWRKVGSCSGTMSPTSSPNYVKLANIGNGCPKEFDVATRYETGDYVTVKSSNDPLRQIVFKCKSPYCNAGPNFAPGSESSDFGWILKGHCTGTIAPTSSPVAYAGSCQYNNGTAIIDIQLWSETSLMTYNAGTRVRKADHVYQCKSYPFFLWCKMSAYEPEVGQSWRDAWKEFGTC